MNNITKYTLLICIGITIGLFSGWWFSLLWEESAKKQKLEEEAPTIVWRQNHFILNEVNLHQELLAQGIDFPDVVKAQALLETGNFKSYNCIVRNNLFGLRKRDGSYMTFDHWTLSVSAYKKYIQKYDQVPKDYYQFLQDLGYAEDPDYITKLKQIVNK